MKRNLKILLTLSIAINIVFMASSITFAADKDFPIEYSLPIDKALEIK